MKLMAYRNKNSKLILNCETNKPKLIIADEPTGNVDPNMSYEIVELLMEINRRGTTVLMVTHEHQLVRDFNKRVVMIENGHIIADNADGGAL